jgi:hypothetical protein
MVAMNRKQGLLVLFGILTFLLAACGGDVFERAYTASGDGLRESELSPDEQFSGTDDLNVVVKLNRHGEDANVESVIYDPNGDVLERIEAVAPDTVGTVVLGVDYEARADQVNQWIVGRYRVEVFVDGELVETLFFRVD